MASNISFLLIALAASIVSTWALRELALKYNWLAIPREDRWHSKPTALHGGIAFYPIFFVLFGLSLFQSLSDENQSIMALIKEVPYYSQAFALLLGSLLMFVLGWLDDIRHFGPAFKLMFQLIAASLFVTAGGVIPVTDIELVNIGVTYFWFIGITNAVNMLDNMDGLAAGIVCISTLSFVLLIGSEPAPGGDLALIAAILLIGVLCGFLIFNYPPAGIFMGDSGSLSIGYILAALAIPGAFNGLDVIGGSEHFFGPVLALLIPAVVLAVPILDTTLVTLTRKWRAQKASQGGRDHVSHRLVMLGFSQQKTLWILYSFAFLGGITALLMRYMPNLSLVFFGLFILVLVLFGVYLGHVKVVTADDIKEQARWTPLVSELLYKQRAAEILLDMVLIIGCYYLANFLRFGGNVSEMLNTLLGQSVPVVISLTLLSFFYAGVYRTQWRMISIHDTTRYATGVVGAVVLSLAGVVMLNRFEVGQSRSAFVIYGVLLFFSVLATRISFRLFDQMVHLHYHHGGTDRIPVLIYGAGSAGKLLANEIATRPEYKDYKVKGFIDDDLNKHNRELCGLIIKQNKDWNELLEAGVTEIWVSSRQISDDDINVFRNNVNVEMTVKRMRLDVEVVDK